MKGEERKERRGKRTTRKEGEWRQSKDKECRKNIRRPRTEERQAKNRSIEKCDGNFFFNKNVFVIVVTCYMNVLLSFAFVPSLLS